MISRLWHDINGWKGEFGICQAVHRYTKANNKYMENFDKSIESSYICYLDANNLYGWAMPQNLPVKGFKWVKQKKNDQNLMKTSQKDLMKMVIVDIFLK